MCYKADYRIRCIFGVGPLTLADLLQMTSGKRQQVGKGPSLIDVLRCPNERGHWHRSISLARTHLLRVCGPAGEWRTGGTANAPYEVISLVLLCTAVQYSVQYTVALRFDAVALNFWAISSYYSRVQP